MATIHTLASSGRVVRVELDLRPNEFEDRFIYLSEPAHVWMRDTLPTLASSSVDADMSPQEQVFFRFKTFIIGQPIKHWRMMHVMLPDHEGVWELKTLDVRMFGWFPERDHFVIARADSMERCKTHGLYAGYRNETVWYRDELNLNEPNFVLGGDLDDVISNAD